jgi:hypothetical protein
VSQKVKELQDQRIKLVAFVKEPGSMMGARKSWWQVAAAEVKTFNPLSGSVQQAAD